MAVTYLDQEIESLVQERKSAPDDWRRRIRLRVRLETLCLITVPCEPPCEESDVGDKNPCLCGGD